MTILTAQERELIELGLKLILRSTPEQKEQMALASDTLNRLEPISDTAVTDLLTKIPTLQATKVESTLIDYHGVAEPINASVEIGEVDGSLILKAEGYSDYSSEDSCGVPMLVENNEGDLQLRIWADINKEDPSHVISLAGAKDSAYKG
ncbi:hypothetical protein [Vibrio owensii]|uniref:hypothetical protein n=1 Tax=Vibrio harveyi group TaxID=717610 RepID=UPI003CC5C8C6